MEPPVPSNGSNHASACEVNCDPAKLDLAVLHQYLSTTYWSQGLPLETLKKAIAGSLCFGAYIDNQQVGFARVITDRATFAYLCDVFVIDSYQGHGIGRQLMEQVIHHPDLQGLRRFVLVTRDAHGLYERFGFTPLIRPQGYMEILRPDIYRSPQTE
jgi:GNAT superfamily N-acetyltransferase